MKKILIGVMLVFTAIFDLNAQSVNGIQLKDLDVNYLRIIGRPNFGGNKVVVRFEFGQKNRMVDMKNLNILDRDGRRITFNTMIDALNFISSFGYRLVNASTISSGSTIYEVYIVEKIGLINNQGVNEYSNSQNKHYDRSIATSDEEEDTSPPQYETPEEEKTFKERHQEKVDAFKNKFIKSENSPSKENDIIKDKNDDDNSQSKEDIKPKEPEMVNCTGCDGSGNITKTCTVDNCNKGKTTKICTVCNGKYSQGTDECYKCEGQGCEYCEYDGLACGACTKGKKTAQHKVCNGTGETLIECTVCKGKGKIVR